METRPAPKETSGEILDRLSRIEDVLTLLVREKTVKEWYSTAEVAKILGKSEYTVREYCRQKKVAAVKKPNPRGAHAEWLISHEALQQLKNYGPQPLVHFPLDSQ